MTSHVILPFLMRQDNYGKSWFLQLQQQLTDRVGEPVLLTVKMPFDEWFQVEVQTFTDRWGIAAGQELEVAIEAAVEMLLEMDEVVAEITAKKALVEG